MSFWAIEWAARGVAQDPRSARGAINLEVARRQLGLGLPFTAIHPSEAACAHDGDPASCVRSFDEDLLTRLTREPSANDDELASAERKASWLERETGEAFYIVVVREARARPTARAALASWLEAKDAYAARRYDQAVQAAQAAIAQDETSAAAFGARWVAALAAVQRRDSSRFRQLATALSDAAHLRSFLAIESAAATWLAVDEEERDRIGSAERLLLRALDLRQRSRDSAGAATVSIKLADVLAAQGREEEAWPLVARALAEAGRYPAPTATFLRLQATDYVSRRGLRHAARAILEARRGSIDPGDSVAAMDIAWEATNLARQAGRSEDAIRLVAEARRRTMLVDAPEIRVQQLALIDAAEGSLLRWQDPASAWILLERARERFERTGQRGQLSIVLLELGRLANDRWDTAAASAFFARAVGELESSRDARGGLDEAAFFSRAADAFGEWIDTRLDLGRTEEALAIAERSRAVSLVAARFDVPGGFSPAEAIARARSSGLAFLFVAETPRRLIGWFLERDGLRVEAVALPGRRAVASDVEALLRSLPARREQTAELVALLPARLDAAPITTLEGVVRAPSLRVWQLLEQARTSHAASLHSLLAVADPRTRGGIALPPLPTARAEAVAAMRVLPLATVLTGDRATAEAFMRLAPAHDVLYLALHGVADVHGATHLALTDESGTLQLLGQQAIAKLQLRRAPIVVIAGCRTSAGTEIPLEGVIGLEWAFLAAGARAVVTVPDAISDQPRGVRRVRITASSARAVPEGLLRIVTARPST